MFFTDNRRMERSNKRVIAILLLSLVVASTALSAGEITALKSISRTFTTFSTSTKAQLYAPFPNEDVGGPWPTNFETNSCASDGWLYYGLHCSAGHIDAIYLYVTLFHGESIYFRVENAALWRMEG